MASMALIKQIGTVFLVYIVATTSSNLGVDACQCLNEPTLQGAIENNSTTIIHGIVIRRTRTVDIPRVIKTYIMIREVYKHDECINQRLSPFDIITIQTSRNSCGISPTGTFPFPLLRSFIFTGHISYTTDRSRSMLFKNSDAPTNQITTMVGENKTVRLGTNRKLDETPVLNVFVCDYVQRSVALTFKERDLLKDINDIPETDCVKSITPKEASPP